MNHYDSPDPIILSVGEAEEVSIEQVAREIAGGGGWGVAWRDVACMECGDSFMYTILYLLIPNHSRDGLSRKYCIRQLQKWRPIQEDRRQQVL